jgi:hypothetical protein
LPVFPPTCVTSVDDATSAVATPADECARAEGDAVCPNSDVGFAR